MSLLTRLFLLVLLAVLPAIGIQAYSEWELRRIREAQVHEEALRLARLANAEMNRITEGARQLLIAFTETPAIAARDWQGCNEAATGLLVRLTGYVNFGVVSLDGEIVCSGMPELSHPNVRGSASFQHGAAADDFAIGTYEVSPVNGASILPLTEPLRDAKGAKIGFAWATLDLDALSRQFAERFAGPDPTLVMADRDGTIILRLPDPAAWVGKKMDEKYRYVLDAAAEGTVDVVGIDGIERIVGYNPLATEPRGIYVGVGLMKSAAFAGIERASVAGAVLMALCLSLALAAAWAGGNAFVRQPINALLSAAERWRRGDYAARAGLAEGRSEIGRLGRAFDEMASALAARESERAEAEERLRRLNESLAERVEERTRERDRIWEVSEDLLGVGNFDGYFVSFNPAWTRVLGWSEDEIRRMHVDELRHPDDLAVGTESRRRLAAGVPTVRMENRFRCKDGGYRWIYWTMTAEQGLIYVIGRDVTAEKAAADTLRQAEDQLRQSQKMQALGQLTGGIAHDFNNLLTIIIGNLEIIERSIAAGVNTARRAAKSAMNGALRAANLTQRLLAYAQKQPLNPSAIALNQLVASLSDLIRQTHGEGITCELSLGDNLGKCFCDANQLETALLNLIINARDAMPRGGKLVIETAPATIDAAAARQKDLAPGNYVALSVYDDGAGMSEATRAAAFEPFFTTKGPGKGTGLGLSMVYGFIKQSHGHVEIESALGRGTVVRLLLPQVAAAAAKPGEAPDGGALASPQRAGATILVVEDDENVQVVVADMLDSLGYGVLLAGNGDDALALLAKRERRIDLMLTDVMLPGMNGREVAERARKMEPSLKVLFMTGYARDVIVHQGRLDPGIELIEKPFHCEMLAQRLSELLDDASGERRVAAASRE
jgi:PAS domain S-box-containing protein